VFNEIVDDMIAFHLNPGSSFSNLTIYKDKAVILEGFGYQWKIIFREIYISPEVECDTDDVYFTDMPRYQVFILVDSNPVPLDIIEQFISQITPHIFSFQNLSEQQ